MSSSLPKQLSLPETENVQELVKTYVINLRHYLQKYQSINQSNLVFVKRRLNKVLRGASYE